MAAGEASVILRLGELERLVLWQAAVADEWKLRHEAVLAEEEAREQRATAAGGKPAPTPAPAAAHAPAAAATAGTDQEMHEMAGTEASGAASGAGDKAPSPGGKRKKTGGELAAEILAHFAHTARAFYQVGCWGQGRGRACRTAPPGLQAWRLRATSCPPATGRRQGHPRARAAP